MQKSISLGGLNNQRLTNIRSRTSLSNLQSQQQQSSNSDENTSGSPREFNVARATSGVFWGGVSSGSDDEGGQTKGKNKSAFQSGHVKGLSSSSSGNLRKDKDRQTNNNKSGSSNIDNNKSNRMQMWRVLSVCICLSLMGYLSYALSPMPLDEHKRPLHAHSGGRVKRELTVMINTFRRPPQVVDDAIEYYAQCDVVRYIYVVWSEENDPPQRLTSKYKRWNVPEVGFQKQKSSSLNNRFRPLEDVPHSEGIFSVDDDMRVPCSDLDTAYDVWQGSRDSLVGFMPRVHLRKANGLLEYRCWWRVWWHGVYSIILTKAAIFNHKFLEMYTTTMPQGIRDMVDKEKNCEDIAMQFLIANMTGLPPVYVKGHLSDLGVFSGISTEKSIAQASHMDARSMCLNDLEMEYGGSNPLIPSRIIVDNANNWWVNAPSSWWEFVSSDLWAGFFSDPD
jgi:hypothetical protein